MNDENLRTAILGILASIFAGLFIGIPVYHDWVAVVVITGFALVPSIMALEEYVNSKRRHDE